MIDIEDTHRDVILATEIAQPAGYASKGYQPDSQRYVDFIGSYPPGDLSDGLLWGPMREETMTWFHRLTNGVSTPHATAAGRASQPDPDDGHGPLGAHRGTGEAPDRTRSTARRLKEDDQWTE